MSLNGILTRSQTVTAIRQYLIQAGYAEIIPQTMWTKEPIEPTIYPFKTTWNRNEQINDKSSNLYFATSPERYLKLTIATSHLPKIFAISHAFRNMEGAGKHHQPEFLMAEWYQQKSTWQDMMRETQEIVTHIWKTIDSKVAIPFDQPWPQRSLKTLWKQYEHNELESLASDQDMQAFAIQKGYTITNATWEQLFHQIIFNDIEPNYPEHPFFLIDFPSRISPLAAPQTQNMFYAQRFELIINKVELANGNAEQTNIDSMNDNIDTTMQDCLRSMENQSWAGVGLGIDRLAMMVGGAESVAEVQWPERMQGFE